MICHTVVVAQDTFGWKWICQTKGCPDTMVGYWAHKNQAQVAAKRHKYRLPESGGVFDTAMDTMQGVLEFEEL